MTTWSDYLAQHQARFTEELLDFLRIPSISALSAHTADVQRAAEWVAARLRAAGMEHIEIMPTEGHPVVYADWLHAEGKPTIMIYGHFDVQPVDPLSLWDHPPFEPFVEGDRVYARGASDDKGNMFAPILALEALLASAGALPVNVKCFFEGQEEIGSPYLPTFVAAQRERFACDLIVSADSSQWSEQEPNILLSFKGLCGLQIDLYGANSDLHSGLFGGMVQNPIHALVRLLDSMRSPAGVILVEGFYNDVVPLTAVDRARIAAVPFDEAAELAALGISEFFGEQGYTPRERSWARPTLEVNGIWGGFQGEGSKTVLPNEAHAKITCRLVANQDPLTIRDLVAAHIARHLPPGVRANVALRTSTAKPYAMPADDPANMVIREVLVAMYGREPYYIRSGGSIPVCTLFREELGTYTASFGFALPDERIHAPNEFFRFSSFRRGQAGYCHLLQRLG